MNERFSPASEQAAIALRESGSVLFGDFELTSGGRSPFYINLGRIISHPIHKQPIITAYAEVIRQLSPYPDLLAGIPQRATPLASSISDKLMLPQIMPRVGGRKSHGTGAVIYGDYQPDNLVVVIDDVITDGQSKILAIAQLEIEGNLRVSDVVVLVDRCQGGRKLLTQSGYNLHSVFTMPQLLEFYYQAEMIDQASYDRSLTYLDA